MFSRIRGDAQNAEVHRAHQGKDHWNRQLLSLEQRKVPRGGVAQAVKNTPKKRRPSPSQKEIRGRRTASARSQRGPAKGWEKKNDAKTGTVGQRLANRGALRETGRIEELLGVPSICKKEITLGNDAGSLPKRFH